MDTYNSMPIELRNWIKEQLRSMERGELDIKKTGLMLDFIEKNINEGKGEIFDILLTEVLEEEEEKKRHIEMRRAFDEYKWDCNEDDEVEEEYVYKKCGCNDDRVCNDCINDDKRFDIWNMFRVLPFSEVDIEDDEIDYEIAYETDEDDGDY